MTPTVRRARSGSPAPRFCPTSVAFLGSIGAFFVVAASVVVGVFTGDPAIAAVADDALRVVALGFAFFAYGMVAMQAFNGAGDTTTPMLVNFGCFWGFKIPLAYLLARVVGMGPLGVFIAIAAAYTLQALVAGWLFRGGRWAKVPSPPVMDTTS